MAELVVRSQCNSVPRKTMEGILNVTFPVWGIISPLASIVCLVMSVIILKEGQQQGALNCIVYMSLLVTLTLSCLMLKRSLAKDFMIVDRQGVRLPRLIGNKINLQTYIPWESILSVTAVVSPQSANSSKLSILKKDGKSIQLNAADFDHEFLEQWVLSARMWAPSVCDPSLDELQNTLRIGMRKDAQASYTDLWEEELGRRFCPTAYIALEPGKVLRNNSLKIVSHLASGGLSALYLCQLDGRKLVVLKEAVVPESSAESVREKARELFEREAHLLMKLDNPAIVKILDCFVENGRNYMILEHANGIDLRQLVKQNGPQNESDVLEWALQIATALKFLHDREQPIIHRDLTPDNIVLRNDGQIVIVDFGAANEFIGNATGTFVGKHSYIAPEQLRGKATVHSDIYAFGCTLYFLLTGKEPEALSPSILKEHNPQASDELSELIESCTQLEAADRYQSVAQLIPVLRRLAAQSIVV